MLLFYSLIRCYDKSINSLAMTFIKKIKNIIYRARNEGIKTVYEEYERYVSPTALIFGFIMDNLTLRRADLLLDNIILLSYLTIVGLSITIFNAHEAKKLTGNF